MAQSFSELLFEGALNAVRTLSLEELYRQRDYLTELNLPDDITEFPRTVLAIAIAEKRSARTLN